MNELHPKWPCCCTCELAERDAGLTLALVGVARHAEVVWRAAAQRGEGAVGAAGVAGGAASAQRVQRCHHVALVGPGVVPAHRHHVGAAVQRQHRALGSTGS